MTFPQAINAAKAARAGGDGSATVIIWGAPEAALQADSRLCLSPEAPRFPVVYHISARQLLCGRWTCDACGQSEPENAEPC